METNNRLSNYFLSEEYEPNNKPLVRVLPEPPRNRPSTRGSLARAKVNTVKEAATKTLRSGKRLRNNNTKKNVKKPNLSLVKFMKTTSVSKTNVHEATKFQEEIEKIPIYFINGHACICNIKGPCHGEETEPLFKIPDNAYLLTFGTATDFCGLTEYQMPILHGYVSDIRKYLLVHSASNVNLANNIGKSKFSFFADLKRAAQNIDNRNIVYPNMNYSFNNKVDDKLTPRDKNPYGVYRLDVPELPNPINNTFSIIPQDPKRRNWFLSDIITEVYKKTRVHKGIFINGGCLSSCTSEPVGKHMDKAGQIMAYAHTIYPTLRETLTKDEALALGRSLPRNYGLHKPFTFDNPDEMKEFVNAGLYDPSAIANMDLLYHEENKAVMKTFVNPD
jgi:hypothetical protein